MPDPCPVRVGVAVFVWHKDRFLLGQRKGSHGAGTWSLPGGRLEADELAVERAHLEVLEETGLVIPETDFLYREWEHTFWNDSEKGMQNWVTLFFEAYTHEPDNVRVMEPDKCVEWRWVKYDDEFSKLPLFRPLHLYIARRNIVKTAIMNVG